MKHWMKQNKDFKMLHNQENPKLTPSKSVDSFSTAGLKFSTTFNPSWKKLDRQRALDVSFQPWSIQRAILFILFCFGEHVKHLLALGMKIFDEVLHQVNPLPDFDFIDFDEILE